MLSVNNSVEGLYNSMNKFANSANRISKMGLNVNSVNEEGLESNNTKDKITLSSNNEVDLTKEFVQIELSEVCYKANAKVIGTSDKLLGSVLDIKA